MKPSLKKLAINGGKPLRKKPFPAYKTIGVEEKKAVEKVIETGVLSKFLGSWHDQFYGGEQVRSLEKEWAKYFGVKHAIAVNSCTSGLYCAVGAASIGPGDEVIVSPYTMTASCVAPLVYNAIPVFADVEEDYFCLDPKSVEEKITKRTKAIIVVDLFGQPYDVKKINKIAKKNNLIVIEDTAQAPGAKYKNKFAGTLGDIGVYSLNYHKHIHCGEGGIVVTDDDKLAERVRLIRNHAEAVVEAKKEKDLNNMLGFNYRMTEVEAAIARCQLKKLDQLIKSRQKNCRYIEKQLKSIPAIKPAKVRNNCEHVYYVHPFKFDQGIAGISRDKFLDAVKKELPVTKLRENEGVKVAGGYVKPLYLQPMFQAKKVYGETGCPFESPYYEGKAKYEKGLCPVTEKLYEEELFFHEIMHSYMKKKDLDDVLKAFNKVWDNRKELL